MALIDPAPIDIRIKELHGEKILISDNHVSFLAGGTLCVLRLIKVLTILNLQKFLNFPIKILVQG